MIKNVGPKSIQEIPTQNTDNLKAQKDPKIDEAAKMYEQMFLKEMVAAMRQAVPKADLVKENMAEKIYQDKMYENYVEEWSKSGGVGLSDIIYDQIIERYYPQQKTAKPEGTALPIKESKPYDLAPTDSKGLSLNKKI